MAEMIFLANRLFEIAPTIAFDFGIMLKWNIMYKILILIFFVAPNYHVKITLTAGL